MDLFESGVYRYTQKLKLAWENDGELNNLVPHTQHVLVKTH